MPFVVCINRMGAKITNGRSTGWMDVWMDGSVRQSVGRSVGWLVVCSFGLSFGW